MNRKVFSLMVLALGGMFLAGTAWAQNSTGTVEAIGIQRVRVQPKAIRFVYLIQASGKTPEGAVKLLQIQRDAALPKLKELGAQGDSIHSTPVALATGYPQAYNPYYTAPVYGTPATPYYAPPAPANYGPPAMPYAEPAASRTCACVHTAWRRIDSARCAIATRLPRLISCRRRPCRPTRTGCPTGDLCSIDVASGKLEYRERLWCCHRQ